MKASSWLVVYLAGSVLGMRAIAGLPVSGSAGDTNAGAPSVVKTNEAPAEAAAELAQALEALSARDRAVQDAAVQTLVAMKDTPGWHVGVLGVIHRTDRQDVARRAIDALVTGELARADAKPVELPNPGGQPTVWRGVDSLIDRTGLEGISEQAAAMLDAALLRSPRVPMAAMQKRLGDLRRAGLWPRYLRLARAAGVDVVPMILADIQSSDPRVRASGLELLGSVERPEIWTLSLARARSDDPAVRAGSLGGTFFRSREEFTSGYSVSPPTETERRRWAVPYAKWIDGLDDLLRSGPDDVALTAGVHLRAHGALTDDRLGLLLRRAWAIAEQPADRGVAVDVDVPNQMPAWLLAEIILMALEPDVERVHQRLVPGVASNAWWMPHVLRVSDPPRWPDELLAAMTNLPVGPEDWMSVTSMIPSVGARGSERLQNMLRGPDADARQRAAWMLIAGPRLTKQSAEELVHAAKSLSGSKLELAIIRTLLQRAPSTPGLRELCAQLVLRATDATAELDRIEYALSPLISMERERLPPWANGPESVLAPIFANPQHALHDRYCLMATSFDMTPNVPGMPDRQAIITKAIDDLVSTPHRDRVWSSPPPEEWTRELGEQMATEFQVRQSARVTLHNLTYDQPDSRAIEAMLKVLCDERFIGPPPPAVRSVYEYISAADARAKATGGAAVPPPTPDAASNAEAARRRQLAEAEHGRDEARHHAWYQEQTLVHAVIDTLSYQVSKHPSVAEQLAASPSWRTNPQIALRVALASVPRNGVASERSHARVANENWAISPALLAAARPAIFEAFDSGGRSFTATDSSQYDYMIRPRLLALLSRLARLSPEPDAELVAKLRDEMRFGKGPFGPLDAMRAMAGFRGEARRRPQPAAGADSTAPATATPTGPVPFDPNDFDITYAVNAVDPNDPVIAEVLAEWIATTAPDRLFWWASLIADTAPAGKPPRSQLANLIAARATPDASSWTLEHIVRALTTADPTHPAITDINARLEAMYAEVPKQR